MPLAMPINPTATAQGNPQYDAQGMLQPGTGGLATQPSDGGMTTPARPSTTSTGSTGNTALDQVYAKRTDLQQLYSPNGNAINPNDPRVSGIPTLNDWMGKYGINEETSLQGTQNQGNTPPSPPTPPVADSGASGGQTDVTPQDPYQQALASVQGYATTPQPITDLQKQIDDLTAARDQQIQLSSAPSNTDAIPVSEKTGIAAGAEAQARANYDPKIQTLTQQLANLQANRQQQFAASQAVLGAYKPIATPFGTSLTNPITGQTMGGLSGQTGGNKNDATGGASDLQILGYLQRAGLSGTRYNMPGLIAAVRAGASAQDIISGKANVAGAEAGAAAQATNKTSFMLDGNGNLIEVQPRVAGAGAAPSSLATTAVNNPPPIGTQSNQMTFTLASDGRTVLANGTPIDLPTFKQLTGQANVPDSKVNFSAVQKTGSAQQTNLQRNSGSSPSFSGTLSPSTPKNTNYATTNPVAHQYFLSGDDSIFGKMSLTTRQQTIAAAQQEAQSLGINNWSAAKVKALNAGDAANYAQTVQKLTDTTTALANADNSFKQIVKAYPGLNSASSPLWNKTANEIASNLTGGQRIAFQGAMTELGNEYSQVFSRGGVNTVNSHISASGVIDPSISMRDLKALADELQAVGKTVTNGWKDNVNNIMSGYGPKTDTGLNLNQAQQGLSGSNGQPIDLSSLNFKF